MGRLSNSNTKRKRIQEFGLLRQATVWDKGLTSFIDPYLMYNHPDPVKTPSSPEWSTYTITCPSASVNAASRLLNEYAVSHSHDAYVTFCVQLTEGTEAGSPRVTAMRYAEMIADNYVHALTSWSQSSRPASSPPLRSNSVSSSFLTPSPLAGLRWLGVANILHAGSRDTFKKIFCYKGRDIYSRGIVEIRPDVDFEREGSLQLVEAILNDPFTRGVFKLLRLYREEMESASVRRFLFLSNGYDGRQFSEEPSPLELRLDLIVELARPGK
ncbi:hypothetical protein F4808DRAFT_225889 [Astrocystis sublimbata]|nr:hypothetical protein F4808DRAFT_225889 [Astrocystis sublimbata]